jgi:hypothetical protein
MFVLAGTPLMNAVPAHCTHSVYGSLAGFTARSGPLSKARNGSIARIGPFEHAEVFDRRRGDAAEPFAVTFSISDILATRRHIEDRPAKGAPLP